MPGGKHHPAEKLLTISTQEGMKGKRAKCKFCFTEVAYNGTRMDVHMNKCVKTPIAVKQDIDAKTNKDFVAVGQEKKLTRFQRGTESGTDNYSAEGSSECEQVIVEEPPKTAGRKFTKRSSGVSVFLSETAGTMAEESEKNL